MGAIVAIPAPGMSGYALRANPTYPTYPAGMSGYALRANPTYPAIYRLSLFAFFIDHTRPC
ncbi:hypothetical protein ZRA01_14160 [Zoogloea ramigera]|uniref:Uncharacterized protein n=1 Tax=Zoogloea ramigera TaxID=350 RepID=A0A4Y4CVQ6_ZOORA|nr:hypothetical protein ZRA01_14160 [Zoogloea ramigera]